MEETQTKGRSRRLTEIVIVALMLVIMLILIIDKWSEL
jgi:hypothetical protein